MNNLIREKSLNKKAGNHVHIMTAIKQKLGSSRRNFFRQVGLFVGSSQLVSHLGFAGTYKNNNEALTISTEFPSGGGNVELLSRDPITIRFTPHDEGGRGWGQMWWYFSVSGMKPGEKVELQLELGSPTLPGINKYLVFSYDSVVWEHGSQGQFRQIDGNAFFVYEHWVKESKVWFAYDLPYPVSLVKEKLFPLVNQTSGLEPFVLCTSRKGRDVYGFSLKPLAEPKYGVWLQARSHAFETGASWVLHELLYWLCSTDPAVNQLRLHTEITIIPIIDVDAVAEGRTGKNQPPYDHNRGWERAISHWPEVNHIKSLVRQKSDRQMLDLFIDLHGPGNDKQPYFIVPLEDDLPTDKQRANRRSFFNLLGAKTLSAESSKVQSMKQFHVSERPVAQYAPDTSSRWVMKNTNDAVVTLTLEVNMKTLLSTQQGYADEAVALGRGMSKYFSNHHHRK